MQTWKRIFFNLKWRKRECNWITLNQIERKQYVQKNEWECQNFLLLPIIPILTDGRRSDRSYNYPKEIRSQPSGTLARLQRCKDVGLSKWRVLGRISYNFWAYSRSSYKRSLCGDVNSNSFKWIQAYVSYYICMYGHLYFCVAICHCIWKVKLNTFFYLFLSYYFFFN